MLNKYKYIYQSLAMIKQLTAFVVYIAWRRWEWRTVMIFYIFLKEPCSSLESITLNRILSTQTKPLMTPKKMHESYRKNSEWYWVELLQIQIIWNWYINMIAYLSNGSNRAIYKSKRHVTLASRSCQAVPSPLIQFVLFERIRIQPKRRILNFTWNWNTE